MKHAKWKELLSIILSALFALVLFFILLLLFRWSLILCIVLSTAMYVACCMLLRPVEKIGNVEVDSLDNGEFLSERLSEAASDYSRMKKAAVQMDLVD